MLQVYVDESGAAYEATFVITALFTKQTQLAERVLMPQISSLKRRFRIPEEQELKAGGARPEVRKQLLTFLARRNDIAAACIVSDISKFIKGGYRGNLGTDTPYFHLLEKLLIPLLVFHSGEQIAIHIDDRLGKVLTPEADQKREAKAFVVEERMKAELLKRLEALGRVDKAEGIHLTISHEDSKDSSGIQAVDFVANAIWKKYRDGDPTFYTCIRSILKWEHPYS